MRSKSKIAMSLLMIGLVSCTLSTNTSLKEESSSLSLSSELDSKSQINSTSNQNENSSYLESTSTSIEEIKEEEITWKKFKDSTNNEIASTKNGSTIFTSSNPSYSDLLNVALNGNLYNIAGPTNDINPIAGKEYVFSMDIVSDGEFKMVLFASEDTKMNYSAENIKNNVSEKMGVYLTFKAGIIELTTALGQGTPSRSASCAVGAVSTNASIALDGNTSNNIKVSLERSTVINENDKVMMSLYLNDTLITFRKLIPDNNEDNLGFSLRTEWVRGVSDGVSIFSTTPSAYIRLSRGISSTSGLGSGLGFISNNQTTMSNFTVLNVQ